MKKMFKIMAMLLIIATVIFAAGCAQKSADNTSKGTSEEAQVTEPSSNESGAPSAEVTEGQSPVAAGADGANGGADLNVTPGNGSDFNTPGNDTLGNGSDFNTPGNDTPGNDTPGNDSDSNNTP